MVDFLKHLPVRKQTALKTAPKTLAKVRHTLQAYAIARPSTRLSLKVLKAKNDKGNWVYAPKAGASVPDGAMKVVDKRIPAHCQWISWRSSEVATAALDTAIEIDDLQDEEGGSSLYRIEAFLPKPDAGKYSYPLQALLRLTHVIRCFSYRHCGKLHLHRLKARYVCAWCSKTNDYNIQKIRSFGLFEVYGENHKSVSLHEHCVPTRQL